MTGVLEHGHRRVRQEWQQVVGEHGGWFDFVMAACEHKDRHVDVGKTRRDILHQTMFRPSQSRLLTGSQTVFHDLLPKLGSKRLISQHPVNALLNGLLVVVGVHRQLLQLFGGTDGGGGAGATSTTPARPAGLRAARAWATLPPMECPTST